MAEEALNENSSRSDSGTDVSVDGIYLFALLWKYKFLIIAITVLAGVGSIFYALNAPVQYRSTVDAVPPQGHSLFDGGMSGLGSALRDFGLTKLAGGAGGEGYTFVVILDSRSLRDSLIERFNLREVYEIPEDDPDLVYVRLKGNLEFDISKEGNYRVTFYDEDPVRAAEVANAAVDYANEIALRLFRKETGEKIKYMERRLAAADSMQSLLADSLKRLSAKYFIISPEEQAADAGSALSELKAEKMKLEVIYDLMKSRLGAADPQVVSQKLAIETLENKIEEAKRKPGFAGDFPLDRSAEIGIEYLKLYSELEAFTKLKDFLLPMLEQDKLDQYKDFRSLIPLDAAKPAAKKARPKRSFIVAGAVLGAFIFSILLTLLINGYVLFRKRYKKLFG